MSGLRNRLEEVIRRYETAETLVKKYKKGEIDEENLGKEFRQLRKDRKNVDRNNYTFIQAQRSEFLGSSGHGGEEDGVSLGSRDTEEGEEEEEDGSEMYNDEEEEEEEEDDDEEVCTDEDEDGEEEDVHEEEDGTAAAGARAENVQNNGSNQGATAEDAGASPPMTKSERKLWKRYGAFWESA